MCAWFFRIETVAITQIAAIGTDWVVAKRADATAGSEVSWPGIGHVSSFASVPRIARNGQGGCSIQVPVL